MTDFDDLPHHGDTDDAADARWFRNAVAPVVDARPVADAWEDIRARATGEAPTVVHLDRSPRTAPAGGRRRLALAAAAVLAVAAIGTGIAVTRDGGDDDQRLTVAPEDTATGWYVPEELPDGWELESVETDWMDVEGTMDACPCDQFVWTSPDGRQSIGTMSADADKFMLDEAMEGQTDVESVVLAGDIDAHAGKAGPYQVVSWVEGDRGWQVASLTIGREALIAAAGRVAADPTVPPVDSYRALTMSIPALDGVRAYHSVRVLLRHPERGISVGYQLEPYPDTMLTLLAGAVEELDPVTTDQPLHKVMIESSNQAPGSSGEMQRHTAWFLGQWPGAAISAGLEDSRLATGPVTADDIESVLRSLRPATGDEWQTFIGSAEGSVDDDARTDRLSDLIVADGASPPEAADGSASTVFSPDQPNADEPGRPITQVFEASSGMEATVTLHPFVSEGESLTVTWSMGNPTQTVIDVDACAWQVVDVGKLLDLNVAGQVGCDEPATVRALRPGETFGGTTTFNSEILTPGQYQAVMGGPDGDDDEVFRVQFVVLPPDDGSDASRLPEDRFIDFALHVRGPGSPVTPDDLFTPMVGQGLGPELKRERSRYDIAADLAWDFNLIGSEYAGREGIISVLDYVGVRGTRTSSGPLPLCAGSSEPTSPSLSAGQRMVLLEPADFESCLDWYGIVLVVNPDRRISSVHLYLWEP